LRSGFNQALSRTQYGPQVVGGGGFIAGHNQMQNQPIAQLELSGGVLAAATVLSKSGFERQFAARVFFGPCWQWEGMVFPDGQFDVAPNPSVFVQQDFLGDHDVAKIVARGQVIEIIRVCPNLVSKLGCGLGCGLGRKLNS
jgi:hypothetical protein